MRRWPWHFGVSTLVVACLLCPRTAPAQQAPDSEGFVFSGDLRLRGEYDIDRVGARPDRARPRIRFRLAVLREVVPHVTVGARIATGSDATDPNSPHQTLGDGFQTFLFRLDRAYLQWTPPLPGIGLSVYAGKFGNPFASASGYNELVWDADIQPEGVAAVVTPVPGVRVSGGQYLVLHRSPGESVGLSTAQLALSATLLGELSGRAAVGFYALDRPDAAGATILARENQGNALVTQATTGDTLQFASDFDLIHAFASLRYGGIAAPITLTGQYMANTSAADGFDDDGFAIGGQIGELGAVGSWRVLYQYQELGRESVFSPFVQDDFLDGTNLRGHVAAITVVIWSGTNANLWSLWSAGQEPRVDDLQKRFRLDINVRF